MMAIALGYARENSNNNYYYGMMKNIKYMHILGTAIHNT